MPVALSSALRESFAQISGVRRRRCQQAGLYLCCQRLGLVAPVERRQCIDECNSENHDFVPDSPDTTRFTKLPAESLRRMISNGTLNADGSVNMATVHRLGWDRRPGWTDEPKVRSPVPADAP